MKRPKRIGFRSLSGVRKEVVKCRACPRLVKHRESVEPRAAFRGQTYWRRPVAGFGDPDAGLVVVGLAPALHGGNRTGRVFTGDNSGRFLVKALYKAGFANQPVSESKDDGLGYTGCYVTAAVKCVPPGDRPSKDEFENCGRYLDSELSLLKSATTVLALGSLAFKAVTDSEKRGGANVAGLKFLHGARYDLPGGRSLYASYHPSPRNTNTGKLTEEMLVALLQEIKGSMGIPMKHDQD